MLELLWWLSIATGTLRARSTRLTPALVGGSACIYLGVADLAGTLSSDFATLTPWHLFIFMFLGPSMWHLRGPSPLPTLPLFTAQPVALRIVRLLISASVAGYYIHRRSQQHPLLDSTYRMEEVLLPFVAASVIDALELVIFLAAAHFAAQPV